ncbi:MAG TPA: zinc-dependent alcohol dehydrogenase family protein [Gemmataceae bacterium]|nr:zinc-dependent alcohol dehydrogenase family protein [Gemmataceae bacterium]
MKAAIFDRFGVPEEVLQVREVPLPEPGRNQVRLRMLASPINPSDLMTVRGEYGSRPTLPATPGFEGVGVVDKSGGGLLPLLRRLKPGRRVAFSSTAGGAWAEFAIVSARQLVPVPDDIPDEQAASFFVNPASALVMTQYVLKVPPGEWLLQTAAGSALGRMVIRLGKHFGFRTINVVRRREQAEELSRAGADAVICTADESIPQRARALTEGRGVKYAIDPVGGETGSAVIEALGAGGRLLIYGTLSREPIAIDPRLLIVGSKRVEGFWLSEWVREQRVLKMLRLSRTIRDLMRAGILTSEVGATFPLDEVQKAVAQAAQAGRSGKVQLRLG